MISCDGNLEATAAVFTRAKSPEDIFGLVGGATPSDQKHAVNVLYRKLARILHPDRNPGSNAGFAAQLFGELARWKHDADAKIDAGTYGNGRPHETPPPTTIIPQIIKTPKREYLVSSLITQGDLADLYACTYIDGGKECHAIFKIVQSAADNGMLENESEVLFGMYPAKQLEEKFFRHLPKPLDSFLLRDSTSRTGARRVNVIQRADGYVSVAEVVKVYPSGLDFRDMVWMFKRCLAGLGFVHRQGVVHGAVLPSHLLVHPTGHGAKIVDWCYAIQSEADHVRAVSKPYKAFYPPEVFAKKPATAATDLFMLARCMVQLLGGDITTNRMPYTTPKPLRSFLGSCLIENPVHRPNDAWKLHEELDDLLQRLVGEPKYRALVMPEKV